MQRSVSQKAEPPVRMPEKAPLEQMPDAPDTFAGGGR
jgi:hypothetical protein